MMKIFLTLIFCLVTFKVSAQELIQVGCFLYDKKGSLVKNIPGNYCDFRKNGERVTVLDDGIKYIDANDNIIWANKGFYHHQIRVDEKEQVVAALTETKHMILGCETYYDVIELIDLKSGKKKRVVDFLDIYRNEKFFQGLDLNYLIKAEFRKTYKHYECSTTHVNSIYQIKENSYAKKNKSFSPGNWIVNFSINGIILVFDRKLENILWSKHYDIKREYLHDVQFTEDGLIVAYVNKYLISPGVEVTAVAAIDPEADPKTAVKIYVLKNDGKLFRQRVTGGIDFLEGDNKMISVYNDTKGYQLGFYNGNWKLLKKITPFPSMKNKFGIVFQEARMVNLTEFLKNYKGQF